MVTRARLPSTRRTIGTQGQKRGGPAGIKEVGVVMVSSLGSSAVSPVTSRDVDSRSAVMASSSSSCAGFRGVFGRRRSRIVPGRRVKGMLP